VVLVVVIITQIDHPTFAQLAMINSFFYFLVLVSSLGKKWPGLIEVVDLAIVIPEFERRDEVIGDCGRDDLLLILVLIKLSVI